MLLFSPRYKVSVWTVHIMWLYLICSVYPTVAHHPHDVIAAVAISPNFDQDKTVFVIARHQLKKSTNGGLKWKQLENGLDNRHMLNSIEISPSYAIDKTIFISSYGDGIYRSKKYGESWNKVNSGLNHLNISSLKISPLYASDKTILAISVEGGLYKRVRLF